MKTAALQDFSYDPFDPAVMADPLPYYRVLREHHPVYYLDKWDAFALSRFADIWDVLAVNDRSCHRREHCPPQRFWRSNDGPVPDPPLHPMPFPPLRHPDLRQRAALHRGSVPAEVCPHSPTESASCRERLDELLPRGAFDLTQEYGGIVRHRCVRNARSARRSCPGTPPSTRAAWRNRHRRGSRQRQARLPQYLIRSSSAAAQR
jgi:hypothetical protein